MIAILGAYGTLGTAILRACSDVQSPSPDLWMPSRDELDVTNELQVRSLMKKIKPGLVINVTGIRDVAYCEAHQDHAYAVNGLAPSYLAKASEMVGAKFVQVSSDHVFDGTKQSYTESDTPNPIQVYGRTKLLGEEAALKHGGVVIRPSTIYGSARKNFISSVLKTLMEKESAEVSGCEQVRSPMSADFSAASILLLAHHGIRGEIYNLGHDDSATREALVMEICNFFKTDYRECFRFSDDVIGEVSRPKSVLLDMRKTKAALKWEVAGSWKTDLTHYLRKLYNLE